MSAFSSPFGQGVFVDCYSFLRTLSYLSASVRCIDVGSHGKPSRKILSNVYGNWFAYLQFAIYAGFESCCYHSTLHFVKSQLCYLLSVREWLPVNVLPLIALCTSTLNKVERINESFHELGCWMNTQKRRKREMILVLSLTISAIILLLFLTDTWTIQVVPTGFEPMTSAMLAQCSINWAMKPDTCSSEQVNFLGSLNEYCPDHNFCWFCVYFHQGWWWESG